MKKAIDDAADDPINRRDQCTPPLGGVSDDDPLTPQLFEVLRHPRTATAPRGHTSGPCGNEQRRQNRNAPVHSRSRGRISWSPTLLYHSRDRIETFARRYNRGRIVSARPSIQELDLPRERPVIDEVFPHTVTFHVPKIRRGGYIFLAWVGDHSPRHVHVYRDGLLVVKWDLDNWQPMKGRATARIRRLLSELVEEGKL